MPILKTYNKETGKWESLPVIQGNAGPQGIQGPQGPMPTVSGNEGNILTIGAENDIVNSGISLNGWTRAKMTLTNGILYIDTVS